MVLADQATVLTRFPWKLYPGNDQSQVNSGEGKYD